MRPTVIRTIECAFLITISTFIHSLFLHIYHGFVRYFEENQGIQTLIDSSFPYDFLFQLYEQGDAIRHDEYDKAEINRMTFDRKLFACCARKPQQRLRHASLFTLRMLYSEMILHLKQT